MLVCFSSSRWMFSRASCCSAAALSDLRLSAGGFGACFLSGTLGGYLRVFSVEVGLHHSPLRGFARSP